MQSLGIYIEGDTIQVAVACKKRSKSFIKTAQLFPYNAEGIAAATSLYHAVVSHDKNLCITSALDANAALIRSLSIPLKSRRSIVQALAFELEGIFPFPIKELAITPVILKASSDNIRIAATKTEAISKQVSSLPLDIDTLSCVPQSLWRLLQFFYPKQSCAVVINIGQAKTCATLIVDNYPLASYNISFGYTQAIDALVQDVPFLKDSALDKFTTSMQRSMEDPSLYPHFSHAIDTISKEIEAVLLYFQSKKEDSSSFPLLITGAIESLAILKKIIIASIAGNQRPLLDIHTLEYSSASIAIGCALDAVAGDGKGLNFRQKEHLSNTFFKRRIKKYASLAVCSFTLFIGCYVACEVSTMRNLGKVKALCNLAEAPLVFTEDIDAMASKISISLARLKKSTSLAPGIPSASHVLSWLSSHPHLKPTAGGLSAVEAIDIQKIHYIAGKNGELKTPQFAKVELELFTASPRAAKEFYASLQRGEGLVDASRPITWSSREGHYKTSFYLQSL